jgi:hypothetical protein
MKGTYIISSLVLIFILAITGCKKHETEEPDDGREKILQYKIFRISYLKFLLRPLADRSFTLFFYRSPLH